MGKGTHLGEFEQLVMLALARVGPQAYSVPVHEEILARTGRDVAIASVYVTLARLEDKGMVRSETEPRAEATGRPRRFYALTVTGWEALDRSRQVMDAMWDGVSAPESGR